MDSLRKTISILAITASATLGLTIVNHASPAHAALSNCYSGAACAWNHDDYGSVYFASIGRAYDYQQENQTDGSVANDKANSVANMGNTCDVVFWQRYGYTGNAIRFNNPADGGTTRDPHLGNGGGYSHSGGSTINRADWRNIISSHSWTDCS